MTKATFEISNESFYFQKSYSISNVCVCQSGLGVRGSLISVSVVLGIFFRGLTWTNLVHSSLRRRVELRSDRIFFLFYGCRASTQRNYIIRCMVVGKTIFEMWCRNFIIEINLFGNKKVRTSSKIIWVRRLWTYFVCSEYL